MPAADPLIELRGVTKDYRALRPLRIERFTVAAEESVALVGFDRAMAEVLVDLIMGTTVPDSGDVRIDGRSTADIADGESWLRMLDQFGLLSERAVIVDRFTAAQNLAMPFSLEIGDMPAELRAQVGALAEELEIGASILDTAAGELSADMRLRIRLGRALALRPRVLLAEHPNALVPPEDGPAFAARFARIVEGRRMAAVLLTADRAFAAAAASKVLVLQPRSGELTPAADGWRRWFA